MDQREISSSYTDYSGSKLPMALQIYNHNNEYHILCCQILGDQRHNKNQ